MANNDFVVRNGIQVNTDLIVASNNVFRVVANTLHVNSTVFTLKSNTQVVLGNNFFFANSTRVGIFTASPAVSLDVVGTDGIKFPAGNTSQRPSGANGTLRYNNELNQFEGYSNSAWGPIAGGGGGLFIVRQGWTANSSVNNNFTVTGSYVPQQIDVYQNGVRLDNASDVDVSSGSSIVLAVNAAISDTIYVVGTGNTVSASNTSAFTAQQFTANSTVNTTFTVAAGYSPGMIQVFLNGVKLLNGPDVDVSSGTTITLTVPGLIGDRVDVFGIQGFNIANALTTGGGTIVGSLVVQGSSTLNATSVTSISVSGNTSVSNLAVSGNIVSTGNLSSNNLTLAGFANVAGVFSAANSTIAGFINVASTGTFVGNVSSNGIIIARGFTGNAVFVTNTEVQVGNSTQNSIITSTRVTTGNSAVNTFISSTDSRLSGNTVVDVINYTRLDKGNANGTITFTPSNDIYQKATLNGAATIQFGAFPSENNLGMVFIEAVNWGNVVVTFANTVNWAQGNGSYTTVFANNGTALANSGTNWITVWSVNGGTTLYGTAI